MGSSSAHGSKDTEMNDEKLCLLLLRRIINSYSKKKLEEALSDNVLSTQEFQEHFILINQLSDIVKAYIQSSSLVILVLNVSDLLFPISFEWGANY